MPERIQLRRVKGWSMPPNTVSVARPGPFGNPFLWEACQEVFGGTEAECRDRCVEAFRVWLGPHWRENWDGEESQKRREVVLSRLKELRGKNLACWCRPGKKCHADVLLEIANK